MRHVLVVSLLLAGACVERTLDNNGVATTVDLAVRDQSVRDFGQPDLPFVPIDLAHTSSDAGTMTPVKGVPCGSAVCDSAGGEVCCPGSGVPYLCKPAGAMNGCGMGVSGLRCDGPEECLPGRRCYGSDFPDPGYAPMTTRCRMNGGSNERVVCHVDADCPNPGDFCATTMPSTPGETPLKVCLVLGP